MEKCDRGTTKLHARILRGEGVQKKKPNMFTVGSPTSASQDRCGIADREDGLRGDTCCGVMAKPKLNGEQKSAAELAIPTD